MRDQREFSDAERAAYAEVDAALRSAPLRPAPGDLVQATLARVRRSARPPFRLKWIDLALGAFGAVMAALALAAWGIVRQAAAIDPRRVALAVELPPELLALGAIVTSGLMLLVAGAVIGVVLVLQKRRAR